MPNRRVEVATINLPKSTEKKIPELEQPGDEEGKPFSVAPVVQFGQRRDSPSLVEFPCVIDSCPCGYLPIREELDSAFTVFSPSFTTFVFMLQLMHGTVYFRLICVPCHAYCVLCVAKCSVKL